MNIKEKNMARLSPLTKHLSELQRSGKFLNFKAYGSELIEVMEYTSEEDCQTLQRGSSLFVGTMNEASIYITGFLHGSGL